MTGLDAEPPGPLAFAIRLRINPITLIPQKNSINDNSQDVFDPRTLNKNCYATTKRARSEHA